jgi:hypothetical protein
MHFAGQREAREVWGGNSGGKKGQTVLGGHCGTWLIVSPGVVEKLFYAG